MKWFPFWPKPEEQSVETAAAAMQPPLEDRQLNICRNTLLRLSVKNVPRPSRGGNHCFCIDFPESTSYLSLMNGPQLLYVAPVNSRMVMEHFEWIHVNSVLAEHWLCWQFIGFLEDGNDIVALFKKVR